MILQMLIVTNFSKNFPPVREKAVSNLYQKIMGKSYIVKSTSVLLIIWIPWESIVLYPFWSGSQLLKNAVNLARQVPINQFNNLNFPLEVIP